MTRLTLLAVPLLLALPFLASAHASGVSYQTESGPYTIDIGYSNAAPQEGEAVLFDFRLRKGDADVSFSDVWVKVTDEKTNAVVFASGIHNNRFGGSRMSYVFPKAGTYSIAARYENDSTTIVETSFPLTILPAPNEASKLPWLYGGVAAGGVALGTAGFFIGRRFRRL